MDFSYQQQLRFGWDAEEDAAHVACASGARLKVGDEFWGHAPPPLLPPRTARVALWVLEAVRMGEPALLQARERAAAQNCEETAASVAAMLGAPSRRKRGRAGRAFHSHVARKP